MRIERITHTEKQHIYGEFGPGYDTTHTWIEEVVYPEYPEEKEALFNTIRGLRDSAVAVQQRINSRLKEFSCAHQAERDKRFVEQTAEYERSWKIFSTRPERKEVRFERVLHFWRLHSSVDDVLEYIINISDNKDTFYSPINRQWYEAIINFNDWSSAVDDKLDSFECVYDIYDKF